MTVENFHRSGDNFIGASFLYRRTIAEIVGRIDQRDATRIRSAVLNLGPLPKVDVRSRSVLRLILTDKKTRGGVVHFVLPKTIGNVEVANDVPGEVICGAVEELRRLSSRMAT